LDVAESLMPFPGAAGMRASIALKMGDADDALQKYIKISDADRGLKTKVCSSMCALYSDTLSTQDVARLHTDVFNFVGKAARRPDSFTNDLDPHRRLRIGLVTGDFHHQHPVNIFMQPMLKRLNRDNFEVTVYFTGRSYDEQTRLAKRRVERWQDCASWSDAQLAERIEGDAIDVLVDLAGHTSTNRLGVFALRAAPVQASFLGYPHSTGLPSMDWLFGDETVSPEEHLSLFSEKLALFPECVFCWAPENQYPLPAPRARNAPLVFGSFNNANKISPGTIELWSRILLLIPGSRLLLKAPTLKDHMVRDVFAGRFERNGVSPDRLELRGPSALDEMMREYGDMDIALDPLPYNGGTTTMQALWMGVPVLTRTGGNFAQRMGTSFLKTLGRQDLIASNEDGYVAAAERLAGRLDEIRAGREQLRSEMLASKVCAIDEYVCHFEALLRKMWQARCAGEEPRVLKLS
jgi:predicted O-linked N-acetylglucosamine transferase (SPINDLY family)